MFLEHLRRLFSKTVVCHIKCTSIWSNWLIVLFEIFSKFWLNTFFLLTTALSVSERDTLTHLTVSVCLYLLSSIKSGFSFCFMHVEMILFMYVLRMISYWLTILLLCNVTLLILFVLKSTLSDIYIVTQAFMVRVCIFPILLLLAYLCIYI